MKRASIIGFILLFLISSLLLPSRQARAQDGDYPEAYAPYTREELAQMLAPVALYPDALLSQILMASTYPIEVIEADRWVGRNPGLREDALDAALLARDWDPSVKALCHFPSILALMSVRISETTEIGNAFLAQEGDVMDTVQELRARAYARGNLVSDGRQSVIVQGETIIIRPAAPQIVYVPYYDPFVIYGPWWYPAHPPWYWGPAGVSIGFGISYWPAFRFSFTWGSWSYFDWPRRIIFIDVHKRPRFVRHDHWIVNQGRWHHAPVHRRGVVYRDTTTARKYGQDPQRFRNYRRNVPALSGGRDQHRERDRRLDNRSGDKRNTRGDDRLRIEREREKRQPVVREREVGGQGQKRQPFDRTRPVRENVDRARGQQPEKKQAKQEPVKPERVRTEGERGDRGRQGLQQAVGEDQDRRGAEDENRGNRGRSPARAEDGGRASRSSEDGGPGRQGGEGDFHGRGRSGDRQRSGGEDRRFDRADRR